MTISELLRQDGALALLAIGAAIGFFIGLAFGKSGKRKAVPAQILNTNSNAPALAGSGLALSQTRTTAITAAIIAAVNQYRKNNL